MKMLSGFAEYEILDMLENGWTLTMTEEGPYPAPVHHWLNKPGEETVEVFGSDVLSLQAKGFVQALVKDKSGVTPYRFYPPKLRG